MEKETEGVKEEGRAFEKSILSEVPEELRVFRLPQIADPQANLSLNQEQQNGAAGPAQCLGFQLKLQAVQPQSSISPSQQYEEEQANLSNEIGNEIEGAILRNRLKNLSLVVLELIHEEGQTTKKRLKQLLIDKFQSDYGSLSEKTIKNLGRRYYDILNSLIQTSLVKQLRNKRISSVENIVQQQERTRAQLYRQIQEQNQLIKDKQKKLDLVRNARLQMSKLNKRNRISAGGSKKIALPFYAYFQEKKDLKLPKYQSGRLTIRSSNMLHLFGQNELLEHMVKAPLTKSQ